MSRFRHLQEIGLVFFKLGVIGFGGPAAHISMMEAEVVRKRKWMDHQHFLDLIGATNLIPGPNSTEMTMHCGYERGGLAGLVVAGLSFIFPAVVITALIAMLYDQYGQLPEVQPFLLGIKPVVLVIIATAIIALGKKAVKSTELALLGLIVVAACLLGLNEITALVGAGIFGILYFWMFRQGSTKTSFLVPLLLNFNIVQEVVSEATFWRVFFVFLKIGAILYGSGYVLFAYLDAELVYRGWITRAQLMDAVAVGQMTPGPVLSTATFVGYQLSGWTGAISATIGIFLPSFLLVYGLNPLVPRMRNSRLMSFFLDSVNVASVAVMLSVLIHLSGEAVLKWQSILIAVLALFFSIGPIKIGNLWLVLGGAILGYFLFN